MLHVKDLAWCWAHSAGFSNWVRLEFGDWISTGYGFALTLMPVLAYCHINQHQQDKCNPQSVGKLRGFY